MYQYQNLKKIFFNILHIFLNKTLWIIYKNFRQSYTNKKAVVQLSNCPTAFVGVERFELSTSWPPVKHANQAAPHPEVGLGLGVQVMCGCEVGLGVSVQVKCACENEHKFTKIFRKSTCLWD